MPRAPREKGIFEVLRSQATRRTVGESDDAKIIEIAWMKIPEIPAAASPEQYHDTEITIIFGLFLCHLAASSRSMCYSANLLDGSDSRMRIQRLGFYQGFVIALLFLVFIPSSVFAQANSQAPEQSTGNSFDDLAKSAAAARDTAWGRGAMG